LWDAGCERGVSTASEGIGHNTPITPHKTKETSMLVIMMSRGGGMLKFMGSA